MRKRGSKNVIFFLQRTFFLPNVTLMIPYSGCGPSTYVYCVVCYRVIVAQYVRSVVHVFAYLYTLDDDSERPMDYETSLLPKVFPFSFHELGLLEINGFHLLKCGVIWMHCKVTKNEWEMVKTRFITAGHPHRYSPPQR